MILRPQELDTLALELHDALVEADLPRALKVAARLSSRRTAQAVLEASEEAALSLIQALPTDRSGRVLGQLPPRFVEKLLTAIPASEAARLLSQVPPDYTVDLLDGLSEEFQSEVLPETSEAFRENVTLMQSSPSGSAGSIMVPAFLAVDVSAKVGEALDLLRSSTDGAISTSYVYVLNDAEQPLGVVSVRELVRHAAGEAVKDIMTTGIVAVRTKDSAVEAAQTLRNRRYSMIPVLDDSGRLVGVIRFEHAIDILTDDVATQLVELNAGSRDESFFTPPMSSVRLRLPWMAANIFLNLGAVFIISGFEETIAAVAILAAFLPMITDMGGNIGIQALSVAIRSIALGEVRLRDFRKAIGKEMAVGLVNGLALGALFMGIAYIWQGNPAIGIIAGIALGVNVMVAGVVGGTIPFLVKRLGKDPALMTGPILTTITDITGVSIYLGLSTIFLLG
ncbi:MAG: magnesium transporter [Spirochaetaceae bacterium]|nr:MAG: magnesium transporter [Spirochaetaceae bacterium]